MATGKVTPAGSVPTRNNMAGYGGQALSKEDVKEPIQDVLEGELETGTDAVENDLGVHSSIEHMEEELKGFFRLVEESNYRIQQAAEQLKPLKVEPRAVPSALGLTVSAASGALGRAELRVGRVSQEYNANVPAGHVITQVPGPGSTIGKKSGIHLVISKGPPPDKEKHDTVRKREKVAVLRIKSKYDQEKNSGDSGMDIPVPDGDPGITI